MSDSEYNQCVNDHADKLYRFLLSSIRDHEKARDIVQDAFERLWIKHEDVEFVKAKSYLFTTGYHLLVDMSRKESKHARLTETAIKDIHHSNQYSDLQEVLHQALSKLPDDQKAVILLRDYEGYSYDEIGKITGLSEAQVKVYIFRARNFLKKYIGSPEVVI